MQRSKRAFTGPTTLMRAEAVQRIRQRKGRSGFQGNGNGIRGRHV